MRRQRIVVLGGGSGGVAAATDLGQQLGRDHDVILIDRNPFHVYMPALLMLMTGDRTARDVTRDLDRLARHDVRVVHSNVEGIEPNRQIVHLQGQELPYDYLVVSLGLQTHPEDIPGFREGGQHAWELDAALRTRAALEQFQGGTIVVGVPPGPYRCPPAPFETLFQIHWFLSKRGVRERTRIRFFSPNARPEGPPDSVPVWLNAHAERRGVETHYDFTIREVDSHERRVVASSGEKLPYDFLFVVPPHKPAQVLLDSGMAGPAGVKVEPETLTTPWENVWAIGDAADFPGRKAGVVAHQQAAIVAHNIAARVSRNGGEERLKLHTI